MIIILIILVPIVLFSIPLYFIYAYNAKEIKVDKESKVNSWNIVVKDIQYKVLCSIFIAPINTKLDGDCKILDGPYDDYNVLIEKLKWWKENIR